MNLEEIKKQIADLGGMVLPEFLSDNRDNNYDIDAYVRNHNLVLPKLYLEFSALYGFYGFEEDVQFYSIEELPVSTDHYCSMDLFYGWGTGEFSLISVNDDKPENMPEDLFVFAEGAAGDHLCIGTNGEEAGKVFYWYHEALSDEKNVFLVADRFEDFIMGIKKELPSDDKDLGIVSEWFSDDF